MIFFILVLVIFVLTVGVAYPIAKFVPNNSSFTTRILRIFILAAIVSGVILAALAEWVISPEIMDLYESNFGYNTNYFLPFAIAAMVTLNSYIFEFVSEDKMFLSFLLSLAIAHSLGVVGTHVPQRDFELSVGNQVEEFYSGSKSNLIGKEKEVYLRFDFADGNAGRILLSNHSDSIWKALQNMDGVFVSEQQPESEHNSWPFIVSITLIILLVLGYFFYDYRKNFKSNDEDDSYDQNYYDDDDDDDDSDKNEVQQQTITNTASDGNDFRDGDGSDVGEGNDERKKVQQKKSSGPITTLIKIWNKLPSFKKK